MRHGDTGTRRHGEKSSISPRLRVSVSPCLLIFLLSAFCLLPSASAATWSRQKSGTMSWLHAVQFLDQNHGFVAGSGGTLLETTDGGATWKKISTLPKDTFRDIYFVDNHTGWVVAERDVYKLKTNDEAPSYLLRTDDGGLSWRPVYLDGFGTNARLVRVIFSDALNGWVFGESGALFATHDGGEHWTPQNLPTKHLLLGGAFLDPARGWLVGAGATIIHTSNSGATWQTAEVREDATARFNATSFIGERLGWAVGSAGRILVTTDSGRTWFAQHSNVQSDLLDVKFVSATEGWAAGSDGTVLHTVNSGRSWFSEPTNISHSLERLCVIDRNHIWAVGFGGTIISIGANTAPSLR